MKKGVLVFVGLLVLLVSGAFVVKSYRSASLKTAGAIARCSNRPSARVAEQIRRVEGGLLYPAVIKGSPPARMNLADRMKFYKTPAVSIAVINNGGLEWACGYGVREARGEEPVTHESLFQAASVSKPVAAVGALSLVEQGRLSLDEDVNQKLVSWKVPESELTRERKVTLRGLLSHTSGLNVHGFAGYAPDEPLPTLAQILNGAKPANSPAVRVDVTPGTIWRYSGGGYTVMQQELIDVTGKPFPDLMRQLVLDKLDMRHSTFEQPLPTGLRASAVSGHLSDGKGVAGGWNVYPQMAAAGLWTTASDLALFAVAIQQASAGKADKVLSQKMAGEMLTPRLENWGLGLTVQGGGDRRRFSHGGSNRGFRSFMVAYTGRGQGAVVLTNSENGENLIAEIVQSIAREYGWPDYQPTEKTLANVNRAVYESYVGEYDFQPQMPMTITTENGRLYGKLPVNPREELYPESETKFFLMLPGVPELNFIKDERGRVTGFELMIEGRKSMVSKIR